MPTFPAAAVLHSFSVKRASALKRTPMEDGMVKQLRTSARVLVQRQVEYGFTSKSDYQDFVTWFEDDLNYGEYWFDWTDPVTETVKTARIVNGDLQEEKYDTPTLTYWRVRFVIETWSNG